VSKERHALAKAHKGKQNMSFVENVLTPTAKQAKTLNKRREVYFRQNNGSDFRIGNPRYMTVYDNGGHDQENGTIDRYTVVYTREINRGVHGRNGEYMVTGMCGAPYWPQGVCLHSTYPNRIDKPSYKYLGKKIRFDQLPSDCQKAALRDYVYLYNLCLFGEE
jgi:hypothetical protein